MTHVLRIPVVWLGFVFIASVTWASDEAERACRNLVRITSAEHAIEPGVLRSASDTAPEHCRVRGVVNRAIRFEVTLPTDWNGRMMFEAVGGAAGVIGDTTSLLSQGYAQASTDTGHEITEGNSFIAQPEAALDYAYRGVHLATVAAKKVVERYYGRASDYDYLKGCSNGGRAAILEALRFPNDYDGIVAGAPLFRFQEFMPWIVAVDRAQAANPLDVTALQVLDKATREACDGSDGVEDGVIADPLNCSFDLAALECGAGQPSGCLSAGQIKTARVVYDDQLSPSGKVLSPGVPPGAEAAGDWAAWMFPNQLPEAGTGTATSIVSDLLATMKRLDSTFDINTFDPVQDRDAIADVLVPFDVQTADLSEFRELGGKLLMYQGWNDWPLRPQRAVSYLEEVEAEMGGREKTAEFYRLFMVPGMVHCAGGPGAWLTDWVAPLVAWREEGSVPERLIGTQPGGSPTSDDLSPAAGASKTFTRPHCPYPRAAKYNGTGDKTRAASFSCVSE